MIIWGIKGILVPETTIVVSQSRVEGGTHHVFLPLKIVTYNIHIGKDENNHYDLNRSIQTLRELNADIIGLQEVERHSPRTRFDDQAKEIATALDMEYSFEPGLKVWKWEFGNLLLSKHPILRTERIDLPSYKEQRVGLLAFLDVEGEEVAVLVTHLGLNREERTEQAQKLADRVREIEKPLLVVGDTNTNPQGEELRPLFDSLRLVSDKSLITYPRLGRQIDLILHSSHFAVQNAYTVDSSASDHLPLVADLQLQTL